MEKIITYENLRSFAYVNDALCTEKRGIVLSFFGLGCQDMYSDDTESGRYYADHGVLYVVPYLNPWAWMNRRAVAMTDEIVEVLINRYELPKDLPIVSSGGSMGGLSALVYARYAARTPDVCVANCPACDLVYHYTERPDVPRTLYSAFGAYEGTLEAALKTASPVHLAPEMPKIPYFIFHGDSDKMVNLEKHSIRFVQAMRACGQDITLEIVPNGEHCSLTPEMKARYRRYCVDGATGRYRHTKNG